MRPSHLFVSDFSLDLAQTSRADLPVIFVAPCHRALHCPRAPHPYTSSWGLQVLAKPYPYPFQNTLEKLLILASVLVVLLGLVYTFIIKSSLLVEVLLVTVLLTSLVNPKNPWYELYLTD